MALLDKHGVIERNATLLLTLSLIVVCIGGIVEVAPLFYFQNTIEKVDGMRPYTPLELAGRDIYIREGCYGCHSQMIRPFRDEVERSGPDLARVGGRYSNDWQVQHLSDPRSLVPESIMPRYGFLATTPLEIDNVAGNLRANVTVGVPYSADAVTYAKADLIAQATPDSDTAGLIERYGVKVQTGDFDGDPSRITEMDALVAYLQMLGTLVDFSTYDAKANYR